VTSPQGNPARRKPLLWLQLLGLAALPLEVAGLLLLLAGADPGPLPGLERLFCWALGALAPAVLFWRLPPDLWSLLLVQVPLKLLSAAGALPLLPLLWWADNRAGLAWAWSPLASSPRLVVLLAGASLLSLLLWQWQQIIQALWMVSRPATGVAQTLPLSLEKAGDTRLCIGLPLLLLAPLEPGAPPPAAEAQRPEADAATPQPSASSVDTSAVGDAGPVAPEQGAEQAEGTDLDQQV